MALTRITKGVIKPNENYDSHNINSTGIVTAIGLDINGNGDISGNLSVGGVITYEDVTSIDSVGIITAQKDIHVGAGVSIVGIVTAATGDFFDLDVDGHTELDNVNVAGVTTFNNNAHFKLNDRLYFGNNNELEIYQQGNNTFILNNDDTFVIGQQGSGADHVMRIYGGSQFELKHMYSNGGQTSSFKSVRGGAFTLYHAGGNTPTADQIRLETTSTGLNFPRDIDVDGHTNLDNVSISGITTVSNQINFGGGTTQLQILNSNDSDINHNESNGSGLRFRINGQTQMVIKTDSITYGTNLHNYYTNRIATHSGDSDTYISFPTNDKFSLVAGGTTRFQTTSIGAQIDTTLLLYGAAGNPGRLRLQEGGALSEIMVARNSDNNSFLYFKTEISGSTDTRVVIDESGHFRPHVDSTYDLGITGTRWRRVYADNYYGDGSNLTGIVGVPSGCILLWSGSAASIPSGFVLCNGSNSTPDLRNKFVVGAYSDGSNTNWPNLQPGSTGGSADAVVVSHSHNHNLSGNTNNTGNHSHNVSGNSNNTGGHSHNRDKWGGNFGGSSGATVFRSDANGNRSTNNAGSHSHNISGNTNNTGAHSHNVSISGNVASNGVSGTNKNLPPYYALCYIMKT